MPYSQQHMTSSVIMVHPVDFGFNEQTGQDNQFQHRPKGDQEEIRHSAQKEFSVMLENLANHSIDVIELQKNHTTQLVPDAVFPNNWFSTRQDGNLYLYPMKTPNRQAEVQPEQLLQKLQSGGFQVHRTIDLRATITSGKALEGTGSLIFHHPSGALFAAVSERCDREALTEFAQQQDYELFAFNSESAQGKPIYHTNVLMSCGENFAVMASETLVANQESLHALQHLRNLVDDFIEITESQMSEHFCGNIIQLKNRNEQPCIVMSDSAYTGFTLGQRQILERHGELVICNIPTIEHVGGGSARCMIAENFLPQI